MEEPGPKGKGNAEIVEGSPPRPLPRHDPLPCHGPPPRVLPRHNPRKPDKLKVGEKPRGRGVLGRVKSAFVRSVKHLTGRCYSRM